MREIRPIYSILVAFCLLVFQPAAHAQLSINNSSAYDGCKAQYQAKVSKGYPVSAAQGELTQCMSQVAVQQSNMDAQQEAEAQAVINEALQQQQQQATTTSNSNKRKSGGTSSNGSSKSKGGVVKEETPTYADEPDATGCSTPCQEGYYCKVTTQRRGGAKIYACSPKENTSSNSNSQAPSNASVSECSQQYQALADECAKQTEEAVSLCDSNNNSGMSQVTQVANESTKMLGNATSASIAAACGKAGEISAAANAALAGYSLYCNSGRSNCNEACSKASAFLREKGDTCFGTTAYESGRVADSNEEKLSTNVKSCSALASKAADAQQLMSNLVSTLQNSSQCAALNSSTSSLCAANPRLPGCSNVATECTTTACICAKNPADPTCTGTSGGGGSTIGGGSDSTSRLTGQAASAVGMDGDIPSYGIEQGTKKGGDAAAIDGKQGGSAGIGGGDGAGGGGRGVAGGGGSGDPSAVNSGFYGGGGGMGGWGSGSGGGRAGGAYAGNAAAAAKNGMPNLRSFLPGGKFDPRGVRGIAGATGPDGITGPHTDIWKKVNNRYQVMSPSLLP
jgi:Uncharacterized conserved protein